MKILSGLSVFILSLAAIADAQTATVILHNGSIWTGQAREHFVEALAIRDNKIIAAGRNAEILALANSKTEKIDLAGQLVTPGFNDAHIHFLNGSHGLSDVELTSANSADEVYRYLRNYVAQNHKKSWIVGRGWQYSFFDGGFPHRLLLDKVINDRPAYIRAYDGHTAWVNSKALQLAGIDKNMVFNGFGEIGRDANGEPNGVLKEDAMELVSRLIPKRTHEEHLAALKIGMQRAAEYGITSIQNASGSVEELSYYEELLAKNELTLRVGVAFSVDEKTDPEAIKAMVAARDRVGLSNPFLKANAVKFVLDGVIEGHTAAMLEKYDDLNAADSLAHGQLAMPYETFAKEVTRYDQLGFQIYVHAIGDRGVRETLNAYEQAMQKNASKNRRHRIEHIETNQSIDMPRFAKLGVMASMEPIHAEPDTLLVWQQAIGEKRLANSFAWNDLLAAKASLVFSSDWPACVALNPVRGLHVAVTRQTTDGRPPKGWVAQQKVAITDALYAYTVMGAYSSFDETWKGQLKPGYVADLIVHSHHLFKIDPALTYQNKIDLTMVDGKVIYRRKK